MSGVVVVITREFFGYWNSLAAFSPKAIFLGIITFHIKLGSTGRCFMSYWVIAWSLFFSILMRYKMPPTRKTSTDLASTPASETASGMFVGERGGGNMTEYA